MDGSKMTYHCQNIR